MPWAPYDHLIRPPTRTTTCQAGDPPTDLGHEATHGALLRFGLRSGILADFCLRQHQLWITVELHITGARYEEAVAREGGRYAPYPPSFGLGTTRPQNAQTSWSVTAVQECRSREPGSVSSGLTPTLREDWTHKRAPETPCHARIASSPQSPTAMSPDHWSKLTWDTVSAGGHDLLIQQATWTGYATVRANRESQLLSRLQRAVLPPPLLPQEMMQI